MLLELGNNGFHLKSCSCSLGTAAKAHQHTLLQAAAAAAAALSAHQAVLSAAGLWRAADRYVLMQECQALTQMQCVGL
jgi:hypothetical protein